MSSYSWLRLPRDWRRVFTAAFTAILVASSFVGCQEPVSFDEEPAEPNPSPRTVPFDVDAVVRSVSLRSRSQARPTGVLSPEHTLNDPVLWPAQGHQRTPAMATDGTNFLVVWDDDGDIRATRVSPWGQILDPESLLIFSSTDTTASVPAVAFNGTQYLVVWQDASSSSSDAGNILGARVSSSGVLLDTTARAICTNTASQYKPVVASDGTDFLVAWEDRRGTTSPDIYGTVVRANGTVLTANGVALTTATGAQQDVAIAYGGGSYLVAWSDSSASDIRGARVDGSNTVLARDLPIATGSASESLPLLAFDGTRFLAVWRNWDVYPGKLEGVRLDTAGARVDAVPVTYTSTPDYNYRGSRLTFTGTYFLLTWEDSRNSSTQQSNIYAARISPAGSLLDAQGILVGGGEGYQQAPAVAGTASGALVVWQSDTDSFWQPRDIHGARLGADGTVQDVPPKVISVEFAEQSYLAVGFDGTNYLVAWMEQRGEDEGLYATRVTPAGEVLEPEGLRLDSPYDVSYVAPVHVAFNGQHYMVVWDGTRGGASGPMAARVRPDGTVLDELPLQLATYPPGGRIIEGAAIASDGQDFFIAYGCPSGTSAGSIDICGARILADGTSASTGAIPIAYQPGLQSEPEVTYDGQRYVVTWTDSRTYGAGYPEVYGRKVERDGTLLPEFQIAPRTTSAPVLAANGQGALVVWEGGNDLYGRLLRQDGSMGPAFCIGCLSGYDQHASMTFDGTYYVVVWQNGSIYSTPKNASVYMARVRTDGTVVDTTPIPVATSQTQEESPVVASNGNSKALIAYTRSGAPAVPAVSRVVLRLSEDLTLGAACTRNSDCKSNFCVDGVCCDSACGNGASDCQACSVARGATQDGTCMVLPAQTVCRAARSQTCDVAEQCDGVSPVCPEDVIAGEGTSCSDGNACTEGDRCISGYCWPMQQVDCSSPGECRAPGSCEPSTGACVYPSVPDGTWCRGGACYAGSCEAPPDGGTSSDGGMGASDGGSGDGGSGDGGVAAPDAGVADGGVDAGGLADGGQLPGPPTSPPEEESGCGCTQASGASLWAVLALVLLSARRRGTAL